MKIGGYPYYISRQLQRQSVVLQVDAPRRRLTVFQDGKLFKHVPLKGMHNGALLLEDYLPLIQAEAASDYRRYLLQHRRYH